MCEKVLAAQHAHQYLILLPVLLLGMLVGMQWYLLGVLVWISLITNEFEHLFKCFFFLIFKSSSVKYLSKSCLFLNQYVVLCLIDF